MIKKTISVICAALLLSGSFPQYAVSAVLANAAAGKELSFDSPYAKITSFANYRSDTLVINIQDYHGDYGSQIAINRLLERIYNSDKKVEIYLEGAYKDVDLAPFRSAKNLPSYDKFVDMQLRKGKMTGAEFFGLQHENVVLKGLEEKELYFKNLENLAYLISNRETVLGYVSAFYDETEKSILRDFEKRSKKLFQAKKKYEAGKISHEKYIRLLFKYSGENLSEVKNKYPNIYKTVELYGLKSEISLRKANADMERFLNFLKGVLPYKDYVQIENAEDRMFLLERIYKNYSFRSDELTKFFKYTGYRNSLNTASLVKEESDLFWSSLDKGPSLQKQGARYLKVLDYSKKLIGGGILSYEYEYLLQNDDLFRSVFAKYINADLPEDAKVYYTLSKEFYAVNEKRNEVFIRKAAIKNVQEKRSGADNVSRAFSGASVIKVLVTGGYHSSGLSKILDGMGVSYIVFTPDISSVNKETQAVYEADIKTQSETVFAVSAFQKFLNMSDVLIADGELNFRGFCLNFLDYETIDFFTKQGKEGEAQLKEYLDAFAAYINGSLSEKNRISGINVRIVTKNPGQYSLAAMEQKEDGSIRTDLYTTLAPVVNARKRVARPFDFAKALVPKRVMKNKNDGLLVFQIQRKKILVGHRNLEMQYDFCAKNPDTANLELIAPEILKTAASLIEASESVSAIFHMLSIFQKESIQREFERTLAMYEKFLKSGFDFGSRNRNIVRSYDRLKKANNDLGIISAAQMSFADDNVKTQGRPGVQESYLRARVRDYIDQDTDSALPLFAYAARKTHDKFPRFYSYNISDMVFAEMKDTLFTRGMLDDKNTAAKVIRMLSAQSAEIMPYFTDREFKVEDQEETESALIRSIAALEILADIGGPEQVSEAVKISDELLSLMREKVDIKARENMYLDGLKDGASPEALSRQMREMDDAIEYVRRITAFQNELLKVIDKSGRKHKASAAGIAARDHLIKTAKGEFLEGKNGMEGVYWIRQQAIYRLKNFMSDESAQALKDIIKAENEGFMTSEDAVFVSVNLEASNTKTLSLKFPAAGVLIDYKRQAAVNMLRSDAGLYFENLEFADAKDMFAYVMAASDFISDNFVSSGQRADVFRGFAASENSNAVFASNILLDLAVKEYEDLRGRNNENGDIAEDIINFVKTFAANLQNFSDRDVSGIIAKLETLRDGRNYNPSLLRGAVEELHFILANLGRGSEKNTDWLSGYQVFMISGGGVTEEILKLENFDFEGKIAGLMNANDNGGSTHNCRGDNAEKNGIYSIAQGDLVSFMTSAAALDSSGGPLKNIIKDLMNLRFEQGTSLTGVLNGLKKEYMNRATEIGAAGEFDIFWNKLIAYAAISDAAGFAVGTNSLKNLIFEAIAIDNKGYGMGFMNPDGIYAAMKDFADLLGTKSVAVTDLPYGNITTVTTNGGVEYIGQSYFSHTPHSLNGGLRRNFWAPHNIGEVFRKVPYESAPAKAISKAKLVIAGLCSWVTSFGVQIANKSISKAIAENAEADKILITNPVKDDENQMTWSDSSVSFVERVSGHGFSKMFNAVFGWRISARDVKFGSSSLTEKDVFDGKAGGYRGENSITAAGMSLLKKLGVKFRVISGSIDIATVPRRDDSTKMNYKIRAIPVDLASEIKGVLSKSNRELFSKAGANTILKQEIKESRFAETTALFFDNGKTGALDRAEKLAASGVDSFVFVPVTAAEAETLKLSGEAVEQDAFVHVSPADAFGLDTSLLFRKPAAQRAAVCYYVVDDSAPEPEAESMLAEWFAEEMPTLAANGLIRSEKISIIESSVAGNDFSGLDLESPPFKVLISGHKPPANYDYSLSGETALNFDQYLTSVLEELRKPLHDIAYSLGKLSATDFSDKRNTEQLTELKKLLISMRAWDDPRKRSAILYALKYQVRMKVSSKGIRFIDADNVTLEFGIDATGEFYASRRFLRKMKELADLRIFADMDDNLAERDKVFEEKMKKIFGDLTLYGICNPILITGNTDITLMKRLRELPEDILETVSFYTEVGGLRYVYGEYKNDAGETVRGFVIDDEYLDEISKARIPEDLRNKIRNLVGNADYVFDDLYAGFVKKAINEKSYLSCATKALESYSENDKMLTLIKAVTGIHDKAALIKAWEKFDVDKVKDIMQKIAWSLGEAEYGLDSPITEAEFIEAMKIISLFEYSRIYHSDRDEDAKNREVLSKQEDIVKIVNGDYKKNEADSVVRVSLTPIRVTHIKDVLADYLAMKVFNTEGLSDFKVESSGRTTINIMKSTCMKTLPIEYVLAYGNIPAENFMYSGDEVFLKGKDESNAGIDDSVARLGLEEGNEGMFVASTNLAEPDSQRRPNLIWVSDIMHKNGLTAARTVDAGIFLHEKILERLEYNIGRIAADKDFEPENIVQLLKGALLKGETDFETPVNDFSNFIENNRNLAQPMLTKDILSAA